MRALLAMAPVMALLAAPVLAAPNLYDDFENGVGGDIVYSVWGATWPDTTTPIGLQNLVTTDGSHNHTSGGSQAARAWSSDPAAWNGYTDFGSTNDDVYAEVWVFEDRNFDGTNGAQPVEIMLCLIGDNNTSTAGFQTDYLQVGSIPFWAGGDVNYGWRSKANDPTFPDSGIQRKAGWTRLAIEADSLANGGQVRFYVDNTLIGTSSRSAEYLRWVRIGSNSKSYENVWYDDLRVTPEPTGLLLLAAGGVAVLRRRRTA